MDKTKALKALIDWYSNNNISYFTAIVIIDRPDDEAEIVELDSFMGLNKDGESFGRTTEMSREEIHRLTNPLQPRTT